MTTEEEVRKSSRQREAISRHLERIRAATSDVINELQAMLVEAQNEEWRLGSALHEQNKPPPVDTATLFLAFCHKNGIVKCPHCHAGPNITGVGHEGESTDAGTPYSEVYYNCPSCGKRLWDREFWGCFWGDDPLREILEKFG